MRAPSIHLNGTSSQELREVHEKAAHALQAALNALQECYPNGRDYYPQGNSAYADARAQHDTACKAVVAVRDEVMDVLAAIVDSIEAIEARRAR